MKSRRAKLLLAVLLVIGAGATAMALRNQSITIPEAWNPWAPLRVAATPNLLTRFKLSRLTYDNCIAQLRLAQFDFEQLTDRQTGAGCGFANAVRVRRSGTADVGSAFALSCRTAVSTAMWERHVVQPAARQYFGQSVRRIEHFGSYACRNVYGRPDATRSRHATAEAWDVAGFVLADGRRIRVARDWQGDQPEALFLHAARDGACRFFDGVLSPDYNAAHRDHLHLDRGPYRLCR